MDVGSRKLLHALKVKYLLLLYLLLIYKSMVFHPPDVRDLYYFVLCIRRLYLAWGN